MKTRFFIALISFSFSGLLINGCGDNAPNPHGGVGGGSGGGDMNYEQQALKMEQEDLAKLKIGKNQYADNVTAGAHESVDSSKDPNEVIATVNGETIFSVWNLTGYSIKPKEEWVKPIYILSKKKL